MISNDKKLLETLISKYGKSNVNLVVNRLNEARAKAPSKWTKIKKNSRNIKNSYRGGDIYDRYSGSYYQNDTYTDVTYEGYIMDKNGNEYRVNGKSVAGDSGSIVGGGRDYYVNIFLDDDVIKLNSYSGIMTNSTGSAIINSIRNGYYLEDYLAMYKKDIDYESRKIAAPFIQNGITNVKSNEINKEERKKQLLLSKKEKFFKTYEKLNSISANIDEYGEWNNIKINNSNIEKIDSIENLLDKKFNDLFNTSKYNYAGIEFILEFGSNSAFNKHTYDVIGYDNETYKINTDKIGYTFTWVYISADKINKDLKRALINKWKESSRWSMHKNNQYKELINLVKTSSKPIHFNDKGKSYYNDAYPIAALIVDFERKSLKNKKITKDDSIHNEPISVNASLNNYPKIAYDKMLAWHEGTRKQNVGAMGDEKLKMNYNICKAMGYNKEANILKVEADERGLLLENTQFNTIINRLNEASSKINFSLERIGYDIGMYWIKNNNRKVGLFVFAEDSNNIFYIKNGSEELLHQFENFFYNDEEFVVYGLSELYHRRKCYCEAFNNIESFVKYMYGAFSRTEAKNFAKAIRTLLKSDPKFEEYYDYKLYDYHQYE